MRELLPGPCLFALVLTGCGTGQGGLEAGGPGVVDGGGDESGSGSGSGTGDDTGDAGGTGDDTGADGGSEAATDYRAPGPHAVGVLTDSLVNHAGDETWVDAWFPTTDSGEAHTYGWGSFAVEGAAMDEVDAACPAPLPVVVHSHGHSSIRWEMSWLMEHLASHGWVVVAIDHVGNSLYDASHSQWTLYTQRPAEVQDAFDWLLAESQRSGSRVEGCVDPEGGYVVTGYSFGGYTAYALGGALVNDTSYEPTYDLGDERVRAVVTFAPWNASYALTTGTSEIAVPVLTLGAERDWTVGTQYEELHGAVVSEPRALGVFHDAGHMSFPYVYCSAMVGNGCGSGWVDPEVVDAETRTAVAAFLGRVEGDAGALDVLAPIDGTLSWELVD